MREHPKGSRESLKQAIRGAVAVATLLAASPTAAEPQGQDIVSVSSQEKIDRSLQALKAEWEAAKQDPDDSKAWLTVNSAFEAADAKRKVEIIKLFATKENLDKRTVIAQFFVGSFKEWKGGAPDSVKVMKRLLALDPYTALAHMDSYVHEIWAMEEIQKAAKEYPQTALAKFSVFKDVPGSFATLRSLLLDPKMPRVEALAYIETSKELTPQQIILLRQGLPSDRAIDFEVAASSQSDHFDESAEFLKELRSFPADTFPFDTLRPLSENPVPSENEMNAYRRYYNGRLLYQEPDLAAFRSRIVDRKMEALQNLLQFGQHPVEMSMNALVVFRRLKSARSPVTKETVVLEIGAMTAEREKIKDIDMFAGNTLFFTHGDIQNSDRTPYHPKDMPFFSSKEQVETLRHLVENKGYTFDVLQPVRWIDTERAVTDTVFAQSTKTDVLRWISAPQKAPIRVRFIGHGGPDGIFLSDGENIGDKAVKKTKSSVFISVTELYKAIKQRATKGADMTKDVFVLDGCYQHDFIQKVLSKLAQDNIAPPVFISAADSNQVTLIYPTTPFGPEVTKELSLAPYVGDIMKLVKPGLRSHPSVFAPVQEKGRWRGKQVSGSFEGNAVG